MSVDCDEAEADKQRVSLIKPLDEVQSASKCGRAGRVGERAPRQFTVVCIPFNTRFISYTAFMLFTEDKAKFKMFVFFAYYRVSPENHSRKNPKF